MNNKLEFRQWLSENPLKRISSEKILQALEVGSSYCVSHSICKESIWEINDTAKIKTISSKLLGMRLFRLTHGNTAAVLDKAFPLYKDYLAAKTIANAPRSEPTEVVSENADTVTPKAQVSSVSESKPDVAEKNMKVSLQKTIEYLNTRYEVRLHYDHLSNPEHSSHDMLYKARNSKKDVIWVYYIDSKSAHYISIETEPEYIEDIEGRLTGFSRIQKRLLHPCEKLVFEDYESIKESLVVICDSIDNLFKASVLEQPQENRMKLYRKLYYISKIYDDPSGLSLSKIMLLLGNEADELLIQEILDNAAWATKLAEGIYSFSRKPSPVLQSNTEKSISVSQNTADDYDKGKFEQALLRRYRNGMRFDSIDFENFRETYELLFEEQLRFSDSELEARLRHCGVMYKGRLFPAEGIIDSATSEKLFAYIDRSFSSGKKVLYYKAIFEDLADIFASCYSLADENMLQAYIEFVSENGRYYFSQSFMSKEQSISVDHTAEVEEYMLSMGKPVAVDAVCAALSHVPKDQVVRIIMTDSRFLRNAKGEYFHANTFEISDCERNQIADIISAYIGENEYAIWTDIWKEIQEKMPGFLESNLYLSGLGIRNALAQQFAGKYKFESGIISLPKDSYATKNIYQLYAKHHSTFSLDGVFYLSKELDTVIYFDALAEVSVRVSHDLFVSKSKIIFDVDAVDKAIESFMHKEYIRLREIDSFLCFPNVSYEWNEYLLESYVHSYSKKFVLLNNGFAMNNVAGAIVKKSSNIHDFVDACAAILADAPISLNKKEALNYLAEINMITRRSYRDLDVAINKASQIRARKG